MNWYQGIFRYPAIVSFLAQHDVPCVVAGALRKSLVDQLKEIEFSGLKILHGYQSDEVLEGLLKSSACVALPYISASQSGIIPLANSYGCPVVAFNVGGLSCQVSKGENGELVEPGNVKEFNETLMRVIADSDYPNRVLRYHQRHCSEDAFVRQYEEAIMMNYAGDV